MEALIQVLIGGILLGGLYALVAFGLSLIYGVVRILNFSHGTLLAVGGVAASLLYASTKLHPVVLILVLVPVFFVFGYLFYTFLLQPLERRNHFESTVGTVLVTVGALLRLSDATARLRGATQRNIPLRFEAIEIGEIVSRFRRSRWPRIAKGCFAVSRREALRWRPTSAGEPPR